MSIDVKIGGDGETFPDAFKRMARSTLEGLSAQAAVRAMHEAAAAMCVQERRAAWWFRWIPLARWWWDVREARICARRRILHTAAAAKFTEAAKLAESAMMELDYERTGPAN